MNKILLPWIGVALLAIGGAFFIFNDSSYVAVESGSSNVIVKNGVQYVTLNAKGGYTPRTSTIQ